MTPFSHRKPCAGILQARFDKGGPAPEEPRRSALLHKNRILVHVLNPSEIFEAMMTLSYFKMPDTVAYLTSNQIHDLKSCYAK